MVAYTHNNTYEESQMISNTVDFHVKRSVPTDQDQFSFEQDVIQSQKSQKLKINQKTFAYKEINPEGTPPREKIITADKKNKLTESPVILFEKKPSKN